MHVDAVTDFTPSGVTRLGDDWLATTLVKVLGLCFQITAAADLLEDAATRVFTVESSWNDSSGKRYY